jgi:hypothetical protein
MLADKMQKFLAYFTMAFVAVIANCVDSQVTPAVAQSSYAYEDCARLLRLWEMHQDSVSSISSTILLMSSSLVSEKIRTEKDQELSDLFKRALDDSNRAREKYEECKRKQQEARREKLEREQNILALLDMLAHSDDPEVDLLRWVRFIPASGVVEKVGSEKRNRIGDVPESRKKTRLRTRVKGDEPKIVSKHEERSSAIGAALFGAAIGIGVQYLGSRGSGGGGHVGHVGSRKGPILSKRKYW